MGEIVINLGDEHTTTIETPGAGERIPAQFRGAPAPEALDPADSGDDQDQEQVEVPAEPETEQPADAGGLELDPAATLSLEEDPDTCQEGSLSLHALSEHAVAGSIHLDVDALTAEHQRLHQHAEHDEQPHDPADLRFRAARALATALAYHRQKHAPAAPTRP